MLSIKSVKHKGVKTCRFARFIRILLVKTSSPLIDKAGVEVKSINYDSLRCEIDDYWILSYIADGMMRESVNPVCEYVGYEYDYDSPESYYLSKKLNKEKNSHIEKEDFSFYDEDFQF